jgi:hypothetical protein
VIFAGAVGVDEFDFDVFANVFEVAVAPEFPGIGGGRAAALLGWAIVGAAGGVRLDFVRRAPEDVDVAAIGFPAGDAGGEAFVGVGDAAVVLFAVGVFGGVRVGIAAAPEVFDVLLALFVGGETQEGVVLFFRDDVGDFFAEPSVVGSAFFG